MSIYNMVVPAKKAFAPKNLTPFSQEIARSMDKTIIVPAFTSRVVILTEIGFGTSSSSSYGAHTMMSVDSPTYQMGPDIIQLNGQKSIVTQLLPSYTGSNNSFYNAYVIYNPNEQPVNVKIKCTTNTSGQHYYIGYYFDY